MNSTIYVFGNLKGGYTQYPENYTREIFENFINQTSAKTQVIIHRDKSLMYYGYVRQLDEQVLVGDKKPVAQDSYLGFCVLINGIMLTMIGEVFSVFERAFAELVSRGNIITTKADGKVVANTTQLSLHQEEVEEIIAFMRKEMDRLDDSQVILPPVSYGKANDSSRSFACTDPEEGMVKASAQYAYTYIKKDSGYNAFVLQKMLENLNKKPVQTPSPTAQPVAAQPTSAPAQVPSSSIHHPSSPIIPTPSSTVTPPPVPTAPSAITKKPSSVTQMPPPQPPVPAKKNTGCATGVIIMILAFIAVAITLLNLRSCNQDYGGNNGSTPSQKVPVYYDYDNDDYDSDDYIADTTAIDDGYYGYADTLAADEYNDDEYVDSAYFE